MTTPQLKQLVEKNLKLYPLTPAIESFAHRLIADIIDAASVPAEAAVTKKEKRTAPNFDRERFIKAIMNHPFTCVVCGAEGRGTNRQKRCSPEINPECSKLNLSTVYIIEQLKKERPDLTPDYKTVIRSIVSRDFCKCGPERHSNTCEAGGVLQRYDLAAGTQQPTVQTA